jgi:hypothetical protein
VENSNERLRRCSKAACFDALHWRRCAVWASQKKDRCDKIAMQISA